MTVPDTSGFGTDAPTGAVILLELGKQSTQMAVLNTKLDQLISAKDDHEQRLRSVEQSQQQTAAATSVGRDTQARVTSWAAVMAALGAAVAGYLHH